jgi:hypothetical protein
VPSDLPFTVLFIGGMPRSGTTFLQVAIGASPLVATTRETHLFDVYLGPLLDRFQGEESLFKSADGIRHLIDRKTLNGHLRAIAVSVLTALHAKNPAASVVLEKTPDHFQHLPAIDGCLPEARFVHLVRDPRAVAVSMRAAASQPWGSWAEKDVTRTAYRWRRHIKTVRDASAELGDRFRQIRYEDLLTSGDRIINELYAWLGLPPNPALRPDLRENFPVGEMARAGLPETDPRSESRTGFFRRGEADAWREELSWEDIAFVEAICGPEMLKLGYEPVAVRAG